VKAPAHPLAPASIAFTVLIGTLAALQAMSTTVTLPALPGIAAGLETTPAMAQYTISGFLLGVACGQILSGALSDHHGRRPVLLAGLAIAVVTGIGCTFAQDITTLVALRLVQGFGAAASMILGRAIIRDAFEGEHALRAMSNMAMVLGVVPMLGPPLAGLMLEHLSWRWIYGLLTAITLAVGLVTWRRLGETLRVPDPCATDPRRILANCLEMIRTPASIGFVITAYLLYGGIFAYLALIPFIARDSFGLSASSGGWLVGLSALSIWSGAVINNRLIRGVPVRRMLRASTALAFGSALAVLLATLAVTQGWWGPQRAATAGLSCIVGAAMAFCTAFGMTQSNCIVLSLQPLAHIAGTASALGASVQTLCGALGAWLASRLYDGTPAALGWCMVIAGTLSFLTFTLVAARYLPAPTADRPS